MAREDAQRLILINMVCYYWVSYSSMDELPFNNYGYFSDSDNKWVWNRKKLENFATVSELQYMLNLIAPDEIHRLSLIIPNL